MHTTDFLQPVIDGLKKEEERLEKIAARFEKSHSIHHDAVLKNLNSLEQHLKMLESGRTRDAA
jgi:hypothetical protein